MTSGKINIDPCHDSKIDSIFSEKISALNLPPKKDVNELIIERLLEESNLN